MARVPEVVSAFLGGRRIVVAGVSRNPQHFANAIYRRLRDAGHEVVPLNPNAAEAEGTRCYPDLASVPGPVDGVVAAMRPAAGLALVREAAELGVGRIWFHRLMGQGSISPEAVAECRARSIRCIVGGCPLMYLEPVDPAHRCFRWFLRLAGRIQA